MKIIKDLGPIILWVVACCAPYPLAMALVVASILWIVFLW